MTKPKVLDAGALPRLVELLGKPTSSDADEDFGTNIQFEAAWAITNICSGSREQTLTVARFPGALHNSPQKGPWTGLLSC